jgi:TetR/AcrR family transcriptional regulator, transcriptional repressor for nem operon
MNKAEKTRQLIVEKTAPIFNTKGYAGTSLSDMTDATGLTKGSIYGNFANKDEVALAAFDYNLGKVQQIIRTEMSKESSARKKLLVYVRVYDNTYQLSFPKGGCPILNTATEADDTHPALKKKAADAILSWKNKIVKIVEEGIKSKEFKSNVNAEQIALTIISMIEGITMIALLTGRQQYRKAVMQSVENYINNI